VPDERLRLEPGPRATRQLTIRRYATPRGSVEAQLDHERGTTTILRGERPVLVARWAPGKRMSIREGIELEFGGRPGRVHRPRSGLRASSREVELTASEARWRAGARRGRIVLERDGAPVATHRFGAVHLASNATEDDVTVTVLFTALELWSHARFWTRLFDAF
jgi:hypothetical protein